MDVKGRYLNNSSIERLCRSEQYEKIFLDKFEPVQELLSGLKDYFEFYNLEKPYQALVRKTPAEISWR